MPPMNQTTPATPLDPPQIVQLAEAVVPPADGIISRTIYQDDRLKVVLFGFGFVGEMLAGMREELRMLEREVDRLRSARRDG